MLFVAFFSNSRWRLWVSATRLPSYLFWVVSLLWLWNARGCSGGNSRLSCLLRCGGRYFLDQKVGWEYRKSGRKFKTAPRDRTTARPFVLRPGRSVATASPVARASFSILFRFQVADFNLFFSFFSLRHFQFLLSLVSFSYVEVFENCSGEEQPSFIPARVWGAVFFWSRNRETNIKAALRGIEPSCTKSTYLRCGLLLGCRGVERSNSAGASGCWRQQLRRPWHLFSVSDPGL